MHQPRWHVLGTRFRGASAYRVRCLTPFASKQAATVVILVREPCRGSPRVFLAPSLAMIEARHFVHLKNAGHSTRRYANFSSGSTRPRRDIRALRQKRCRVGRGADVGDRDAQGRRNQHPVLPAVPLSRYYADGRQRAEAHSAAGVARRTRLASRGDSRAAAESTCPVDRLPRRATPADLLRRRTVITNRVVTSRCCGGSAVPGCPSAT
jgi:hypothetical protein